MTWEENRYWKNALTIVPIVGAAFATITYALRLYSRRYTTAGLKLEDWLMGVGLILSYCATAFVVDSEFFLCVLRESWNEMLIRWILQLPSMGLESLLRPSLPRSVIGFNLYVHEPACHNPC